MGSQLSCSLWGRPSGLALTESAGLAEGFAPPERLCSLHTRSVSLMESEPRVFFFFSSSFLHPQHMSLLLTGPQRAPHHKRGDLLECSPKGTSKEQLSWWDWINGIRIITARIVHACELAALAVCVCVCVCACMRVYCVH